MGEEHPGRAAIIRLAIVVEGQTERTFTDRFLAPHLLTKRVNATSLLIGSVRNIGSGGGHVTIRRLVKDIRELYYKYDYETTLVDFYGFQDKRDLTIDALKARLAQTVSKEVQDWKRAGSFLMCSGTNLRDCCSPM